MAPTILISWMILATSLYCDWIDLQTLDISSIEFWPHTDTDQEDYLVDEYLVRGMHAGCCECEQRVVGEGQGRKGVLVDKGVDKRRGTRR
jgi:hypothetical protein